MSKNKELQIIKWNIYNARVPFTTNFSKNKTRPVVVIGIIADDILIIPITSNINNNNKNSIKINLNEKSIIKAGNIQNIHKNDFISPYYINKQIVRLDTITIGYIKKIIFRIIFEDKRKT